jgi:hypothetical protein
MRNALVTRLATSETVGNLARNINTETLVWNGITILVSYEPHWLGGPGEPLADSGLIPPGIPI